VSEQRWPRSWHELKTGKGCGMCAHQGQEDSGWGVRFLEGSWADVFLWRSGSVRGYAVAIWKHRHVAEPTQLPAEQAAGFWLETLRAGAAIERHLRSVKLNYLTLGNALPHLHTHIVPRYADDPVPGRPLPFDFLDDGSQPEERLQADLLVLRTMAGADQRSAANPQVRPA
jgi:diadenosine tetraphosphate (Ap4A) HIT family hydrolase